MSSKDSDISSISGEASEANKPPERKIDWLFGSGTRVDVLWCFLQNPDEWLGSRDLERLTGRSQSDCRRNMGILYLVGLLEPKILRGHASMEAPVSESRSSFRLNKRHPWIPALRMLLERSMGALSVLQEGLESLPGIDVAFVFGSFAVSEQEPESDLDVVIIGSQTTRTLARPISEIEKRIGREIQVMAYSAEAWRQKVELKSHFVYSLMFKPKIFLVGDNERLERITGGGFRQAGAAVGNRDR